MIYESIVFLESLALFCLPGYFCASYFFPRARNFLFLQSTGFVVSLAVVAVVGWPCLWFRTPASTFWGPLSVVWVLYLAASWLGYCRVRRERSNGGGEQAAVPLGEPTNPVDRRWTTMAMSAIPVAFLAGAVIISHGSFGRLNSRSDEAWAEWALLGMWLAFGIAGIPELLRANRTAPGGPSDSAPPLLWKSAAFAMIALLMVGVALQARPDWDDGEYLADVLRYSEGGSLNHESAALPGEGLPVAPHMRLLAWELFGATLCRISGLHPMVSHRTLLPPFLLLMVVAVQWQLLTELLLPRRLVPLAVLGLCTYWVLGNSVYNSAGNLLLTRPWQGKAMLVHLGLPLEILALAQFIAAPSVRTWVCSLVVAIGALAMSSSAVYMLLCLVPTFCVAMAIAEKDFRRWKIYFAAMTSAWPIVVYGLALRAAMATHPFLGARPDGDCWQTGLAIGVNQHGDFGILWLLTLPILIVLLRSRRARALVIVFPLILALTAVNPAVYTWVSGHLTSCWTYRRLFWLFPVGLGFAVLVALVADFLVAPWAKNSARTKVAGLVLAVGLAASLFAASGRYVWSPKNVGPYPGLEPVWGDNPTKIPGDLLPIVRHVARIDRKPGYILFAEHMSPFFVPYSSQMRFVSSRPSYTYESLAQAGRAEEALERVSLAVTFLGFAGTAREYFGDRLVELRDDDQAQKLLDKYRVTGIVLDRRTKVPRARIQRLGFELTLKRRRYELWERDLDKCRASDEESVTWRSDASEH